MTSISWSLSLSVTGGPSIRETGTTPPDWDSYTQTTVQLDAKDGDSATRSVNVPSSLAMLLVTTTSYADDLVVTVGGTELPLSAPIFIYGSQLIQVLSGGKALTSISLTNGLSTSAAINVLTVQPSVPDAKPQPK